MFNAPFLNGEYMESLQQPLVLTFTSTPTTGSAPSGWRAGNRKPTPAPPPNWQRQELEDIEDAIRNIRRTLDDLEKRRNELRKEMES